MRWRWWRPEPVPGKHASWPDHGRDSAGRLVDGDTVRPDGWRGWADLLPGHQADPGREALTEPTQVVYHQPLMTRGQQWRGSGGGR